MCTIYWKQFQKRVHGMQGGWELLKAFLAVCIHRAGLLSADWVTVDKEYYFWWLLSLWFQVSLKVWDGLCGWCWSARCSMHQSQSATWLTCIYKSFVHGHVSICVCQLLIIIRMGHKDGFENQTTAHLHDIGAALIRKMKFSLHENVVEFDEDGMDCWNFPVFGQDSTSFWVFVCSLLQDDYLKSTTQCELQKAEFFACTILSHVQILEIIMWFSPIFSRCISLGTRLSPRMFGEPTSRSRTYRLLLDPTRCFWNCSYSFRELRDMLLLPACTPLRMSPSVFEFASKQEIEKIDAQEMCVSAARHLEMYNEMAPEKQWLDLSSNPDHRKRTESVDGALCTLTTNTRIWSLANIKAIVSF